LRPVTKDLLKEKYDTDSKNPEEIQKEFEENLVQNLQVIMKLMRDLVA
jgi:hypothetical protein